MKMSFVMKTTGAGITAIDGKRNHQLSAVNIFASPWLQVNEYDEYLVGYQKAAVATEAVAATLNAGQGVVLACGLTAVLVAAATATPAGTFTAGDLVGTLDAPAGQSSPPDADTAG